MIKTSDKIAIITKQRNYSFTEMLKTISIFATHTPSTEGAKTLIVSENREGWIFALYAIWRNKGIAVPVDAVSTAHDIAYIINDCKPTAIWVSNEKRQLVEQAVGEAQHSVELLCIDDYEQLNTEAQELATIEYRLEDTALICYTSGTTGSPKGVMLSFENIMANVRAVSTEVPIFNADRRTIVLLPLHHVLPLVGTAVIPFVVGGGVAICPSLAAADIMDTLQRGRIAILIGVPRLWQTLYRGIKSKIDASAVTRALFSLCEKVQSRTLSRLVFKSVRTKMGGAITYCVAGGAALDSETAIGLKTLGLDVLEGYGMTEAAPMITFTRPGDIIPGCAGLPVPSVEVKLVDGELCARGRNIMQGYYNRPEETAAIVDAEGWLHTGDLATIAPTGHVTITGRKKEIIVLSNGKNVNPAEIEEKIEHYNDIVREAAVTEQDDMLCLILVPQPAWMADKSQDEMEQLIKTEILQPYNASVAPYKKLMKLHIYDRELPRTRLEKLQRFKLKDLLTQTSASPSATTSSHEDKATEDPVFSIISQYITAEKNIPVSPQHNLETDLAMDSLDTVALQAFIQQTFGLNTTTDTILTLPTIGALCQYITANMTRAEVQDIDWHTILTQPQSSRIKMPVMGFIGYTVTALLRSLLKCMFSPHITGLENLPADRPYILAPNHQSYIDGPLVVSSMSRATLRHTYFFAKREHVNNPLSRLIARNHNIIVLDMSQLSDSISQLGQVLSAGNNLVIFPEGTRTHDGRVGHFKKTFAILSSELQVPIVPVRITGAYEAWSRNHLLPSFRRVKAQYLPPIVPTPGESYEQLAERVRNAILG